MGCKQSMVEPCVLAKQTYLYIFFTLNGTLYLIFLIMKRRTLLHKKTRTLLLFDWFGVAEAIQINNLRLRATQIYRPQD